MSASGHVGLLDSFVRLLGNKAAALLSTPESHFPASCMFKTSDHTCLTPQNGAFIFTPRASHWLWCVLHQSHDVGGLMSLNTAKEDNSDMSLSVQTPAGEGGGLRSQGIDAGFIWWILSLESPSVAITAVIHFLLLFLLLFPGNVSSQAPILFTVVTKKSNNLESQYSGNCRKRLNPADRKEGNPASRTEWNTDDFSLGITKPPAKWASDLSNKSSQMSPFCGGFWVFKEGYGGIEAAGDKCHPVNC